MSSKNDTGSALGSLADRMNLGQPSPKEKRGNSQAKPTAPTAPVAAAPQVPTDPKKKVVRPGFSGLRAAAKERAQRAEQDQARSRNFEEFTRLQLGATAYGVDDIRITREGILSYKGDVKPEVYYDTDIKRSTDWIASFKGEGLSEAERHFCILTFGKFAIRGGKAIDYGEDGTEEGTEIVVSPCPAVRSEVVDTLEKLVAAGFILGQTRENHEKEAKEIFPATEKEKRDGRNPYGFYILAPEFRTSQPARVIWNSLLELVEKTNKAFHAAKVHKRESTKALVDNDNAITIEDLLAGDSGRMLLTTSSYDIGDRHVGSGQFVIESDGSTVKFLSASGGAERAIERAIREELTFKVSELVKQQTEKRFPDADYRKFVVNPAWRTLQNGLDVESEKEDAQDYEADNATVSQQAFYLDRAVGKVTFYWGSEPFKLKSKDGKSSEDVVGLMFTVERNEEGKIAVVDYPQGEVFERMLAPFKEFRHPGRDFKNMGLLSVFLNAGYDRAEKSQTPAEANARAEARRAAKEQREQAIKAPAAVKQETAVVTETIEETSAAAELTVQSETTKTDEESQDSETVEVKPRRSRKPRE